PATTTPPSGVAARELTKPALSASDQLQTALPVNGSSFARNKHWGVVQESGPLPRSMGSWNAPVMKIPPLRLISRPGCPARSIPGPPSRCCQITIGRFPPPAPELELEVPAPV